MGQLAAALLVALPCIVLTPGMGGKLKGLESSEGAPTGRESQCHKRHHPISSLWRLPVNA